MVIVFFLLWCGVGGFIGYAIGNSKGRATEGFWLGFLLGVIGWIIVAFMQPSDAVVSERAAISAVIQGQAQELGERAQLRPCPWCAELIRPEAIVCRFCGREVEPAQPATPPGQSSDLDEVQRDHASAYLKAAPQLDRLAAKPDHPADWLRELCRRIEAGAPPEAAAERIPLDWKDKPKPPPVRMAALRPEPAKVGDRYPEVEAEYPRQYDEAVRTLNLLPEPPTHPGSWLRELCRRMEAGSPTEAAATRIPLDWQ
jgi:hypothetical protein